MISAISKCYQIHPHGHNKRLPIIKMNDNIEKENFPGKQLHPLEIHISSILTNVPSHIDLVKCRRFGCKTTHLHVLIIA